MAAPILILVRLLHIAIVRIRDQALEAISYLVNDRLRRISVVFVKDESEALSNLASTSDYLP
jgi:hypothetical protein